MRSRVGRFQYRWGILSAGSHDWNRPGWFLHHNGWVVGFRTGRRGWLIMPLYWLAD